MIGAQKNITAVALHNEATTSRETASYKNVTGDTNKMKLTVEKRSTIGRYIPADKKREVIAQTYGKCAYPKCNTPFAVLHHIDRYRQSKTHDSIIPLCKIHHEFAHHNLIQNETLKPDEWRISLIKESVEKISQADVLYRKYRGALCKT
ncbi:HNH endonuclease [Candidatus Peregrinibacteria bacterium]|nr:HNH endonuclease [Candidatus Peregrinibacteria bacterium]